MGAYLNTPNKEKESADNDTELYTYGSSSMQGWRISQEDAHNCCPDFDPDTSTCLFAVYDGHGGSEVSEYCRLQLPNFIKNIDAYKKGQIAQALEDAFLGFDESILKEEVMAELKRLRGDDDEQDTKDEEVKSEIAKLDEEAEMPIEDLLARYGRTLSDAEKEKHKKHTTPNLTTYGQSPALKPKTEADNTKKNGEQKDDSTNKDDPIKLNLSKELLNGHAENENDSTIDKNLSTNNSNSNQVTASISASDLEKRNGDTVPGTEKTDKEIKMYNSGGGVNATSDTNSCGSGEKSNQCVQDVEKSDSSCVVMSASNDEDCTEMDDDDDSEEMEDSEDDSDDDIEDDDDDNDDDIGEEDEDEEEEDEDVDDDNDGGIRLTDLSDKDEPGSDSGTTAVVALLRDRDLYVANAGDSRCVLCRDGKAVDMSFDHKPEDLIEKTRIEKAGGKVTPDGRVNSGLNLSRAIGDHCYKTTQTLPLKEQMITALPDIKSIKLEDTDEFMVLACDGIWNSLTSQEVVDFVRERIKTENKISVICEQLFDHCLAPDTTGDGTGCDNMTCVIVRFNKPPATTGGKRSADVTNEEETAKKQKQEEPNDL